MLLDFQQSSPPPEGSLSNGCAFYRVTFAGLYKDGDGRKRAECFGGEDLLMPAKVADLARTRTFEIGKDKE